MKGDINLLPEEIMSTTSYERPSSGSGVIKLVIGLILVVSLSDVQFWHRFYT